MSDGTINAALRRPDYGNNEHVAHGFRAMARTMLARRYRIFRRTWWKRNWDLARKARWAMPTTAPSTFTNVSK